MNDYPTADAQFVPDHNEPDYRAEFAKLSRILTDVQTDLARERGANVELAGRLMRLAQRVCHQRRQLNGTGTGLRASELRRVLAALPHVEHLQAMRRLPDTVGTAEDVVALVDFALVILGGEGP